MPGWKQNIIRTNRGNFEIFTKGEGTPLCVTHLYSEFNESGDHYAEQFTPDHHVILVNLREAGRSEKAAEPFQLGMIETVFDLEAIREALGYERWIFAGHSTGGMLGLVYGIHASVSLSALIITGAAAREYASSSPECIYHPAHSQYEKMQQLIEELKNLGLTAEQRKKLAAERTKLSLYEPDNYSDLFDPAIQKKMSAVRMNFFAREVLLFGITEQLPRITAKTLILCGRHDVQCPISYSIEMHQRMPGSELVIFEKSNHYPFLEEKKAFNEAVHVFLSENASGEEEG
ncbi:alpha/beta hydrolase [Bacillus marinisedimentorum]|uniref:alpha/beta hydrolase n=1 Tax=Bacillus marinisedimentorum TaxID=1821260 RepID=UPI000872F841|nr:alpha/beta hydrolase [Bacillus marinisedimentorum]